jgi:hypothetical protein
VKRTQIDRCKTLRKSRPRSTFDRLLRNGPIPWLVPEREPACLCSARPRERAGLCGLSAGCQAFEIRQLHTSLETIGFDNFYFQFMRLSIRVQRRTFPRRYTLTERRTIQSTCRGGSWLAEGPAITFLSADEITGG